MASKKDSFLPHPDEAAANHAVSELLQELAGQYEDGGSHRGSKANEWPLNLEGVSAELLRLYELQEPFISVGRLGNGIAHNLNGYLTGLIGHLELMKMKRPELSSDLDTILGLARKLRDGIGEMACKLDNDLTREPQPQNLNQMLHAELSFLKAELFFKHSISVELMLGEPLPNVYGAYADFSLAIENVLMNAIDAQRQAKSPWIKVTTHADADWVVLEIEDGGLGFSPQALCDAHTLLWPGVRSNEEGLVRGGMGLTLARLRLKRWGGELSYGNRTGGGACVKISLPRREKTPSR